MKIVNFNNTVILMQNKSNTYKEGGKTAVVSVLELSQYIVFFYENGIAANEDGEFATDFVLWMTGDYTECYTAGLYWVNN